MSVLRIELDGHGDLPEREEDNYSSSIIFRSISFAVFSNISRD